jgi:hypothetical protein
MGTDTNLIKTFAKQGLKALLTISIFTIVGIFINWLLLLFMIPELRILFDASAASAGHAGGVGAVLSALISVVLNWKASLLFLTFFIIFPFLHFLFAKKYAISIAITSLLKERKSQFVEYIMQKFFDRLHSKLEWLDKLNSSSPLKAVNEYLPIYLKNLEGMPFIIRLIVKLFLARIDFLGIVSGTINEERLIDISQDELIEKIISKVNSILDEKIFSPSIQANLILSGVNIFAFIGIKVFI